MIQHIKNITILFFLLLSLSVSACSKDDYTPAYPKSEGVTRLVSYNVGVFAKYAKSGYKMTARMMKELDADAVCIGREMIKNPSSVWAAPQSLGNPVQTPVFAAAF